MGVILLLFLPGARTGFKIIKLIKLEVMPVGRGQTSHAAAYASSGSQPRVAVHHAVPDQ